MTKVNYRLFNHNVDDPELIFKLFDTVYGDSTSIRQRWSWEFLHHPEHEDVKIYVAEDNNGLVGMTIRMPCTLMIGGSFKRAYFATNSMVMPEYRGQGIICGLYNLAARHGDIQLSKGTAPAMYSVLQKIGYREIVPNTFQVCILSPMKWAISKMLSRIKYGNHETFGDIQFGDFYRLNRFDVEDQGIAQMLATEVRDGVVKDLSVLNWRYFDIPHRRYHVFVRKYRGETVSMLVVRLEGLSAHLVDFRWAKEANDEPAQSIKFAKLFSRKMGAIKLVFWGTLKSLRNEAGKQFFFERRDTPMFSYYSNDAIFNSLDWASMHFIHGDGDVEYL